MFGELPKLFDRDFAIAYFLPSIIFLTGLYFLLSSHGMLPAWAILDKATVVSGTTLFAVVSLVFSVFLLIINREILRFFEGYGAYNPFRLFSRLEKLRYEQHRLQIANLEILRDKYRSEHDKKVPIELQVERGRLLRFGMERFPDQEAWLLPTAFGNTLRAFEVYSRVMYGFEAIQGWNRLLAVIPDNYNKIIGSAKAQTDTWVNLWIVSILFVIIQVSLSLITGHFKLFWLMLVYAGFIWVASLRAQRAAVQWGEYVKSSFDLFLPELRKKLELPQSSSLAEERMLWTRFSQAITFGIPDRMPDRAVTLPVTPEQTKINQADKVESTSQAVPGSQTVDNKSEILTWQSTDVASEPAIQVVQNNG